MNKPLKKPKHEFMTNFHESRICLAVFDTARHNEA